ncbi:MAG: ISAzo13 family transposase, partial [Opitutaceae bacterium]|nr:ISAzo13 family transposase [Opitutaceae bacterium]MDR1011795.1 ISAzo13 family transposase [Opitutaceae bacterium]
LVSAAVIVNLISKTKTEKGLSVRCVLDEDIYSKGMEISDEQLESINMLKNDFHGEWNYTIRPNVC